MAPSVKPEQVPHVPTYDEWQAAQYAPHRFGQDPTAQMPMGRVPTFDEWQQLQSSGAPDKLTFPALPPTKFVSDATKRLNPNAGAPDKSIPEQLGEHARHVAGGIDVLARTPGLPIEGYLGMKAAAAVTRQAVAPALEHPVFTAATIGATAIPGVAPYATAAFGVDMVHNLAKYGYQVVHEQMMTPEERAIAQQDPNRISGEAAAVQAFLVGLMGVGGIHAFGNAADVSTGMMEGGSAAMRAHYTTPAGATQLGSAAAEFGLPATANPYQPGSNTGASWRDGYEKARVQIPGTVEQAPTAVPPQPKPVESLPPAQQAKYKELSNYEASLLDAKQSGPDPWTPKDEAKLKNIQKRLQALVAPEPTPVATPEPTPTTVAPTVAPDAATVPTEPTPPTATEPAPATPVAPAEATPAAPSTEPTTSRLTPIEGTGETRTRGLAQGVEEKAIANRLTETLGKLPDYARMNIADQARQVASLIHESPDVARSVAMGETEPPKGVHPEAVFVAIEDKAIAEGDVRTLRDLKDSKLVEAGTTMGQRIRLLAERNPDSPVAAMDRIENTRSAGPKAEQAMTSEVSDLDKTLDRHAKAETGLEALVNKLRC